MGTVMQRENERGRMVVDGSRTDDGCRHGRLVGHEVGGTVARAIWGSAR